MNKPTRTSLRQITLHTLEKLKARGQDLFSTGDSPTPQLANDRVTKEVQLNSDPAQQRDPNTIYLSSETENPGNAKAKPVREESLGNASAMDDKLNRIRLKKRLKSKFPDGQKR